MKRTALVCLLAGFQWLAIAAGGASPAVAQEKSDAKRTRHISEDFYPPETIETAGRTAKYAPEDSADCYDLSPDEEVDAPVAHDWVGRTHYENQQIGSMGRMISVSSAGTGGYRHVSWMWSGGVFPPGPLGVYASSKPLAGVWSTPQEVGLGVLMSGYSNQTHLNDGTSVVVYHSSGAVGGKWSSLTIADAPSANPLYSRKWDLPDDMPEGASGEVGAWPKCEVLYCTDETVHPDPLNYIHIVETEGDTVAGAEKWIGYLRCYIDPGDVMNLKCQTPTTYPEVYNIPANTTFQDEVYGFGSSCDISAIAVTGRGIVGSRVAIPYMPPAVYGTCDYLSDVAYVECMDNADGWIDGTDWWPTVHNVTNFGTTGNERAYHDLSACYDYEDSLHIVWVTCAFDPANPGHYDPEIARLYHWSKETGISMVASKIQPNCEPMAHNLSLSKPSISAQDPVYHPSGDSVFLYCVWTEVDSSDENAAGDQGNQDLYGSGSVDGGNTWGKVLNLTGTKTPGCTPGNCVSEVWPSMAQNMFDGNLHIQYICDRDAGGAAMGEGTWTRNHVMYLELEAWDPGSSFIRGDATGDGIINVGDVVYLVSYLYKNGPTPSPIDAGDCNCDGIVNVGDVVYLVSYLYKGGPPPGCP